MPKQTYQNLPAEKQERILEALIGEFSEYRFSDASINRIVKVAGIPRGSFYQYFSDKEDAYLLVMDRISREKMEIFSRSHQPSSKQNFFEAAVSALPAIFEWAERCPRYNRIGLLMTQDDSEFIRNLFQKMESQKEIFRSWLVQDQQNGLIRKDIDLDLVISIYISVANGLLHSYYTSGDREACRNKIAALSEIVGRGILSEEGRHGTDGGSARGGAFPQI